MPVTSPFGAALGTEGTLIQVEGGSPAAFETVANAYDFTEPTIANTVEVTNLGDHWVRRFPTLLDMGKIGFKVYFRPDETTHNNTTGTVTGLRYLMINQIQANWKLVYPDDGESSDTFPAFVTAVSIDGKVGDVYHGTVELSNNGAPTLA